jgi:hypothetical protein
MSLHIMGVLRPNASRSQFFSADLSSAGERKFGHELNESRVFVNGQVGLDMLTKLIGQCL